MAQLDMFDDFPRISSAPKPGEVRARLESILATLRGPGKIGPNELRRLKVVVPQMALWLPDDERGAVLAEFERLAA